MSSLEKKSNENDGNDSPNEQKEGTHMLKVEDSLTDDVSVDNEMNNKLAAENKELYVSFCKRFIFSITSLWLLNLLFFFFHRIW